MGYMGDRGRVTSREQYGLWHPPLYVYLLGLNVKLFGRGTRPRCAAMGMAIMALTALVVYGLGHTVAGRRRARAAPRGSWPRRCSWPARCVVQSATVVDIDGTLLLLAMTRAGRCYTCAGSEQPRHPARGARARCWPSPSGPRRRPRWRWSVVRGDLPGAWRPWRLGGCGRPQSSWCGVYRCSSARGGW